ncbi:hypothetical protein TNCV_4604141 [Trichonephila clavipes]|nr:hypothetical protein TNCV_4604141 [Trichonephila clavipes]
MVGNVFVRPQAALFTRSLEETDPHYRSHLSCHRLQSSKERCTNTGLAYRHLVYGLAEGNARATERWYRERNPQSVNTGHCEVIGIVRSEYK